MALTREQAQQKVKEILDLARNEKKTISYQEVMNKLSELDIDADAIDAVFETLATRNTLILMNMQRKRVLPVTAADIRDIEALIKRSDSLIAACRDYLRTMREKTEQL